MEAAMKQLNPRSVWDAEPVTGVGVGVLLELPGLLGTVTAAKVDCGAGTV
jgi:hypothetical protein